MKPFLLAITGQTATGKSELGVLLAKRYNGEIISADSMQVYKGLEIATAQPTKEEKRNIPHHLMGFLSVSESFSVAQYVSLAKEKIEEILTKGKLPILVGGTGLYLDSLLNNISFDKQADEEMLKKVQELSQKESNQELWQRLFEVDPEYAKTLHPNNKKRVLRALALFNSTGLTRKERDEKSIKNGREYSFLTIGLRYQDKEILWKKIDCRVEMMVKRGLVEEAKRLYDSGKAGKTASQAIGYKELIPYFEGDTSLDEATAQIKLHTRQYSKRQRTWMQKNTDIHWIDLKENSSAEEVYNLAQKIVEKNKNLC